MSPAPAVAERVEHTLSVCGLRVHVKDRGSGPATVVLHHSTGPLWTPFYDGLATQVRLLAVDLPGYGRSERPEDARSPRDLAVMAIQAVDRLDLGPVHLVGLGLGGWIAAEMATMNRQLLRSLTLVGAAGIRPESGEIHDPMMESFVDYMRLGFSSPERFHEIYGEEPDADLITLWDFSREMTARITWRPWMWSLHLPLLVSGIRLPTLIVWGENDAVVPFECAQRYHQLIAGSELAVLPGVGHSVDMEAPDDLANMITAFIQRQGD